VRVGTLSGAVNRSSEGMDLCSQVVRRCASSMVNGLSGSVDDRTRLTTLS
jgi:hypothetical protein